MSTNQRSHEKPPSSEAAVIDAMPPVNSADDASGLRTPSVSITARAGPSVGGKPIASSDSRAVEDRPRKHADLLPHLLRNVLRPAGGGARPTGRSRESWVVSGILVLMVCVMLFNAC